MSLFACLQHIRNLVKNSLKQASKDKHQSIALPAIGTGNLGVPRDLAARFLYEEVIHFSNKHPDQTLGDVRFVVYPKDVQTIQVRRACFYYHFC